MADPRGVSGNEHNPDGGEEGHHALQDCPFCPAEDIRLADHLPECDGR